MLGSFCFEMEHDLNPENLYPAPFGMGLFQGARAVVCTARLDRRIAVWPGPLYASSVHGANSISMTG